MSTRPSQRPQPRSSDDVAIVLLSTTDPILRGSASFAAVFDAPDTVVITQDLDPRRSSPIHRHVADARGVLLDEWVGIEHACPTCAVREDLIPLIATVVATDRYRNVVVAPPVAVESLPITRALDEAARPSGELAGTRVAAVATVCSVGTLVDDLLGDDLLVERGLTMIADDMRSVGEVLAHHVGHADFVLTSDPLAEAPAQAAALLEHVSGVGSHLVDDFLSANLRTLFDHSHLCTHASRRVDPFQVCLNGAPERDGVWSMHLSSSNAVHPERLLDHIGALAGKQVRSRGHFWLPTRPVQACIWDGAGGQLSIGSPGSWGGAPRATSLVFTGVAEERRNLIEAFDAVLLTPAEQDAGPNAWAGRDDGLGRWLGEHPGSR